MNKLVPTGYSNYIKTYTLLSHNNIYILLPQKKINVLQNVW